MLPPEFDLSQVFTFLFVMIGPIKLLAPFAKMTRNSDIKFRFQLALRAALFGGAGLRTRSISAPQPWPSAIDENKPFTALHR